MIDFVPHKQGNKSTTGLTKPQSYYYSTRITTVKVCLRVEIQVTQPNVHGGNVKKSMASEEDPKMVFMCLERNLTELQKATTTTTLPLLLSVALADDA